jgi:two-component system NtrC family sensor kinase
MMDYQPSIRRKITFGYYAGVAVILALFVFTFTELIIVEKKLTFGAVINEFFDMTLEMRRFEKNFFLYEKYSDYQENMQYVTKAQDILAQHINEYRTLVIADRLEALQTVLKEYRELMEQYAVLKHEDPKRVAIEKSIREKGKEITSFAEDISKTERERVRSLLDQSRIVLAIAIVVLSLGGIIVGQIMSRIVVRPLKELEESMVAIAAGARDNIDIRSKDREIHSLTTAFNKMLRELELRQRHLLQSEKLASLGTLMAGIAHELNNPLSNISTSSQILIEELEESDIEFRKEMLHQIETQTERARNIVRSLLDFSREKEFKREILPLGKLIHETLNFIKGQIPARVSISVEVPDDIVIFADKQRIQQAFLNLLKNAVEAVTEEGGVFIQAERQFPGGMENAGSFVQMLDNSRCKSFGDDVYITISDTGSGIPLEILPRIMDPFFTTKDVGKGSGLGLSIVHEIIDEHDGCIRVHSEEGKGTTFILRLPSKDVRFE